MRRAFTEICTKQIKLCNFVLCSSACCSKEIVINSFSEIDLNFCNLFTQLWNVKVLVNAYKNKIKKDPDSALRSRTWKGSFLTHKIYKIILFSEIALENYLFHQQRYLLNVPSLPFDSSAKHQRQNHEHGTQTPWYRADFPSILNSSDWTMFNCLRERRHVKSFMRPVQNTE